MSNTTTLLFQKGAKLNGNIDGTGTTAYGFELPSVGGSAGGGGGGGALDLAEVPGS